MTRLALSFEPYVRLSAHFFRWGVHFKLRLDTHWYHLVVKGQRGYAFGQRGRLHLWVGWWEAQRGHRRPLSGFRLGVYCDAMRSVTPSEDMRIPFYPSTARARRRERRRRQQKVQAE